MKKIFALILAMCMVFALCATSHADGPVNLRIAMWGDEARAAAYKETLAPFCEANNCTVDIEIIPISDFFDKMAAQLAAGTAPDVFWLADAKEATFIKGGWCAELGETLKADPDYHFEDFYESAIYTTDYDGKGEVYGVPFSFGARPIFYNVTMFKEAGVKTPRECFEDGTWTYDKMFELAEQIAAWDPTKIGLKLWCVGQTINGVQMLADMLPAYNANLVNADSTEYTMNSKEGIEVMQKFVDAMNNGSHAQYGDDTGFVSGNIAMARECYSYMKTLANGQIDFEWDLVPQPLGPAGESAPLYTGYAFWCANATGENVELSKQLIKFVSNPENQLAWCATFMCPRDSVMTSKEITDLGEGYPSPEVIKEAYVDPVTLHGLYTYMGTDGWTQLQSTVQQNYELIFAGAYTVEEGLNILGDEIVEFLN